MVAHPLAEVVEQGRIEIEMWAAERDLAVTFPSVVSWQDPGRNVVAVFEPAEPVEVAAPEQVPVEPQLITPAAPPTAPDHHAMSARDHDDDAGQRTVSDPVTKADVATSPPVPVMRPIASLDLDGLAPRDLTSEDVPHFDIVDPRELMVDEQYQRGFSPKSVALVRRIVENWSWSKFKVPNCVRVDGQLHVVDGQHSAIAAACHPGIQAIPVLVSAMPEVADRAAAFVSHATNRLQATAVQIHRAALTAGDEAAVALDAVCRAAGVELLPFPPSGSVPYQPRQTVAVVGIRRLIAKRGAERATEILRALAAADLAPISGDHVRLGEALLCDDAYAGGFTPEALTAALRGLTAKIHTEARELAIAQRLAPWRALAAVLYRNHTRPTTTRRRATA